MEYYLYSFIVIVCLVLMYLILYKKYNTLQTRTMALLLQGETADLDIQIKRMKKAGEKKVKIIKFIRKETGLGLLEATKFFEQTTKEI